MMVEQSIKIRFLWFATGVFERNLSIIEILRVVFKLFFWADSSPLTLLHIENTLHVRERFKEFWVLCKFLLNESLSTDFWFIQALYDIGSGKESSAIYRLIAQ